MVSDQASTGAFKCSIAPWLSVGDSAKAVDFYKSAFGAIEVYRHDGPDGAVVARFSVDGAEFWISGEPPGHGDFSPESVASGTISNDLDRR